MDRKALQIEAAHSKGGYNFAAIHQLCEALRSAKVKFCMLHFESEISELFGFFPGVLAQELGKKPALSIANLYRPEPQD